MVFIPGLQALFSAKRTLTISNLVNSGDIPDAVILFNKTDKTEKNRITNLLTHALQDCADFLNPQNLDHRGDDTTIFRLIHLKYTYAFAKKIGVSNVELDKLVAFLDEFSKEKFQKALESVNSGLKATQVTRVKSKLDKAVSTPASEKQPLPT